MDDQYFQKFTNSGQATPSDGLNEIKGKTLLIDSDIHYLCNLEKPMIANYVPEMIRYDNEGKKVIGFGLDSTGYDCRIGNVLKIFDYLNLISEGGGYIDPLNFDERCYRTVVSDEYFILPPNSYAVGPTIEYFNIPNFITPVCLGKSSYARSGIIVNPTLFKPGWSGQAVIEISNSTPCPVKIYANQGIASILFFASDPVDKNYKDRGGRYDGQTGMQDPL